MWEFSCYLKFVELPYHATVWLSHSQLSWPKHSSLCFLFTIGHQNSKTCCKILAMHGSSDSLLQNDQYFVNSNFRKRVFKTKPTETNMSEHNCSRRMFTSRHGNKMLREVHNQHYVSCGHWSNCVKAMKQPQLCHASAVDRNYAICPFVCPFFILELMN
ncbi:hypothetical protein J6590_025320 [Homalodisca vitripennis]|nr:hypothetical protein J6590_025320 [Homalodisca vitripennis]